MAASRARFLTAENRAQYWQGRAKGAEEALALAEQDGHIFGARLCPTCQKVTVKVGRPWGCEALVMKQEKVS